MDTLPLAMVPDSITIFADGDEIPLKSHDSSAIWRGQGVEVATTPGRGEMDISMRADVPVSGMVVRWKAAPEPGAKYLGDHWERGYGDLAWSESPPDRLLPWYFLRFVGSVTDGFGVKTGPGAFCGWKVTGEGIELHLDLRSGGVGVDLRGRTLPVATVVGRAGIEGESPFEAGRAFGRGMCDSPRPSVGCVYGGNNWYYAYGESSHEAILADTRNVVSWSPEGPNRPFMVIDDGWQLCRSAHSSGPWHEGNRLFPDMAGLADGMKKLGAWPGIWHRPLCTVEKLPRSWFLHRENFGGCPVDILDPSIPEVLEEVKRDIRRYVEWGFDLIKHDFSTFDLTGRWGFEMGDSITADGWRFADNTRTTAEIITDLYRGIREAAGETIILGCNTVGHLAAGWVDIQRTGDDTSGREWERTRKMGINTLAFRMNHHGAFYAVDADCVGLTREIPWELNERWLRLLAASGTPLFVSADPKAVGPEQAKALKAAFRLASGEMPVGEPLDWMETTTPRRWRLGGKVEEFVWE